jgi:hypothetical protein
MCVRRRRRDAEGREGVVQMCAGSQAAALGIDFLKTESIANKA